ncbi:hypothetical protein A2U01_0098415, partial [Trifolium medium]|nr:hypothetical protein [Trifolium medium]
DTSTLGSWRDGALPAFISGPDDCGPEVAVAAGEGSIDGIEVPHMGSHSISSEVRSRIEISPPSPTSSTTPT